MKDPIITTLGIAYQKLLPGTPQILPGTAQILPDTPQILPGTAQTLPDTAQILPGTPQILPGTPQILPGTPVILPGTAQVQTVSTVTHASRQTSQPVPLPASIFRQLPPEFAELCSEILRRAVMGTRGQAVRQGRLYILLKLII